MLKLERCPQKHSETSLKVSEPQNTNVNNYCKINSYFYITLYNNIIRACTVT